MEVIGVFTNTQVGCYPPSEFSTSTKSSASIWIGPRFCQCCFRQSLKSTALSTVESISPAKLQGYCPRSSQAPVSHKYRSCTNFSIGSHPQLTLSRKRESVEAWTSIVQNPRLRLMQCSTSGSSFPSKNGMLINKYKLPGLSRACHRSAKLAAREDLGIRSQVTRALPSGATFTGDSLLEEDWEGDDAPENPFQSKEMQKAEQHHEPQSDRQGVNLEKRLVSLQVVCVLVAMCAHVLTLVRSWQLLQVAGTVSRSVVSLPWMTTCQIVPLCVAILIGILLRVKNHAQLLSSQESNELVNQGTLDRASLPLGERVVQLEDDVGTTVRMVRMISRLVEKLGVRFRVTRKILRDSLNETAELAEQTSVAVESLAGRTERLENELAATQKLLLATQEQSVRQLQMFSSALLASQQTQRRLEQRIAEVAHTRNAASHSTTFLKAPPGQPGIEPAVGRSNIQDNSNASRQASRQAGGSGQKGLVQKLGELGSGVFGVGKPATVLPEKLSSLPQQRPNSSAGRAGTTSFVGQGQRGKAAGAGLSDAEGSQVTTWGTGWGVKPISTAQRSDRRNFNASEHLGSLAHTGELAGSVPSSSSRSSNSQEGSLTAVKVGTVHSSSSFAANPTKGHEGKQVLSKVTLPARGYAEVDFWAKSETTTTGTKIPNVTPDMDASSSMQPSAIQNTKGGLQSSLVDLAQSLDASTLENSSHPADTAEAESIEVVDSAKVDSRENAASSAEQAAPAGAAATKEGMSEGYSEVDDVAVEAALDEARKESHYS